jgi:type VI secretion system secreted protein Hcp
VAVDAFLKIEGVDGESLQSKHVDWINVLSYSFGIAHIGLGGGGSGGAAGRAEASDFSFMHAYDKASPVLFTKCAQGAHIPSAQLDVVTAGKEQLTFLTAKFENVFISSVQPSGSSEHPTESVSFAFDTVSLLYRRQDPAGGPVEEVEGGWDFERNRPV